MLNSNRIPKEAELIAGTVVCDKVGGMMYTTHLSDVMYFVLYMQEKAIIVVKRK